MFEAEREPYEICVVGMGYIGAPTASLLAGRGKRRVLGVDVSAERVAAISAGICPLHEPGLDELLADAVRQGYLHAARVPEPAEVYVLAVPTPIREDHTADLSYVQSAARAVAPVVRPGDLVILESTSPVGTTEAVAEWIAAVRPDLTAPSRANPAARGGEDSRFYVAHCPERVLPGRILYELTNNDRIVGGIDAPSTEKAAAFYRSFVPAEKVFTTDSRTAEMAKLTENAFRDVNIAFANELARLCERLDLDVWKLIELANRHPRVGILRPGPGVGGHCIAVDPWFLVEAAPDLARLIRAAREINDGRPEETAERVRALAEGIADPVIACLGLAFKADVDDMRESPAIEVVRLLAEKRIGRLLAVEPYASSLPPALEGTDVELTTLADALERADVVVALVDHEAYKSVDRSLLAGKRVLDTRGIWRDLPRVAEEGTC